MAATAPPADPVALTYPITGLAAVAALAGLGCAAAEVHLTCRFDSLRSLLALRPLSDLHAALGAVLSCCALLLMLVGGDASLRGRGGSMCAAGARLALVAHSARLAGDLVTASAALLASRCPDVRPVWLRRAALVALFLLAWVLAACCVLLPQASGRPCGAMLLAPGAAATILMVLNWSLWVLSAAAEIASSTLQVGFKCFDRISFIKPRGYYL